MKLLKILLYIFPYCLAGHYLAKWLFTSKTVLYFVFVDLLPFYLYAGMILAAIAGGFILLALFALLRKLVDYNLHRFSFWFKVWGLPGLAVSWWNFWNVGGTVYDIRKRGPEVGFTVKSWRNFSVIYRTRVRKEKKSDVLL